MNVTDFRAKYPQYDSYTDQQLAEALYTKHYQGRIDRSEFDAAFLGSGAAKPEPQEVEVDGYTGAARKYELWGDEAMATIKPGQSSAAHEDWLEQKQAQFANSDLDQRGADLNARIESGETGQQIIADIEAYNQSVEQHNADLDQFRLRQNQYQQARMPVMKEWKPTIWERIKGLIPPNKDAAFVEYQMRDYAKEKGISVEQAYKNVGGRRPIFNPEGRAPIQAVAEAAEITAKELPDLIPGAANTILRTIRGGDETAEDTWLDDAINWTEPEKPENPDPNYDALYGIGKSLGYSTSTMVSAIVAGAATGFVTKNPVATATAAGTTAGGVAYRGSRDEFLSRVKEGLDKQAQELYGRKLKQEEWDKAYAEFDEAATKYGAWEAIPEAIGNLVFLRAFTAPMKGMGKQKLAEISKRAGAVLGTENVTETTTAMGQNRAELEAGLTNERLDVGDAFRKQVIPTTIVTGLMGGAGAGVRGAYEFSKSDGQKIGEAMQVEVDATQFNGAEQIAADALNPANAQVEFTPYRDDGSMKSMQEMVAEKLAQKMPDVDMSASFSVQPEPVADPDVTVTVNGSKPNQEPEAAETVAAEPVAEEKAQPDQEKPAIEATEYTTRKGKVIKGAWVTGFQDKDEAKTIDQYTFQAKGQDGFFVREKHFEALKEWQSNREQDNVQNESGVRSPVTERGERGGDNAAGARPDASVPTAQPEGGQRDGDNAAGADGRGREAEPVPDANKPDAPVTSSRDFRALEARVRNTNQESGDRRKVKAASVRRAIEGALADGSIQQDQYDVLIRDLDGLLKQEIDQAANEAATSPENSLPEPTDAQKEAGNYKQGKVSIRGMTIGIENPKGSTRSGVDPDGNRWETTMTMHYGDIKRTNGADGDAVDVFIGENPESDYVYIVDQVNKDGSFDEHKVIMGTDYLQQAVDAYKSNYQDGFKVGPVTELSVDDFKDWLKNGDTTKPYNQRAFEGEANESTELGGKSPKTLEAAPSEKVPSSEKEQEAGSGTETGSRADAPRNDGAGESGVSDRGSVADGERKPSVSTGGSASRGSKPSRSTDGGISERAKPAVTASLSDNFRITPETKIGEGGAKTKYNNNVAAIRVLRDIGTGQATPEQQAILAKYVGWGGIPQVFYKEDGSVTKGWERQAAELKELLTDEEYANARRSTQDAHYTSTEIVTAMWSAVQGMGFAGGRVLEPSVGVGNFFGLLPDGLATGVQLAGVELDTLTATIAKKLYPKAKIQNAGFQDFTSPDGRYDVIIGNPPFGQQKLYDSKRKHLSNFSIHNYFFAKSVDLLRPNGVLAMVVSSRLMDSMGDKARQYIADRTELLGAVRLPNNAFLKNAGTEVTTDVIFLRRLEPGQKAEGASWMDVKYIKDAKGVEVPLNEYFVANPDNMLGEFGAFGSMYRPDEPALVAREGQDTAKLLNDFVAKLPKDIMGEAAVQDADTGIAMDVGSAKVGSMFLDGDTVMIRNEDSMGEANASPVEFQNKRAGERAKGMIQVRDAAAMLRKAQLADDVKPAALKALRKKLNEAYDAFVKQQGYINQDANKRVFRDDPSWPQIAALEDNFDKGISAAVARRTGETARKPSADKAAIFTKRTQSPYKPPTSAATAKDALIASLSERGRVDMAYMAKLYGKPESALVSELEGLVFKSPTGGYQAADEYLSGNVKQKLAVAEAAAKEDSQYRKNVQALKEVQPADIEAVDIEVKPGAHWVPANHMADFLQHLTGNKGTAVYNSVTSSWSFSGRAEKAEAAQWGTDRYSVDSLLQAVANQKAIVVRDKMNDGSTVINQSATDAAIAKGEAIKAEFKRWVWQDESRRDELSKLYNDTFNTDVRREYDGSHLTLPGKVSDDIIKMRPHQLNGIWRAVQGNPMLADHVVGAGKTFTLVGAAMEMRRMGLARKPMFVVPNHLVGQWAEDFVKLYPNARILAAGKKDFEKSNRKRLFARIATGDWDAVIVAHSSFGRVESDPEYQERFIKEQIDEIDTAITAMRSAEGRDARSIKQAEKQKESLSEKLKKLLDAGAKDDNLTFGELGVDALFVDEAHEFKNLGFATGMTRIAGLGNPSGSQKAADLYMKVQYILEQTGGRNVVFATGTPISNTMAEMYTMQRYLDTATLKAQGLFHFDAWANMFGEVVTDWELSPAGKYKMNSRFAKFVNMPELMQRYLSFADVIDRDDINRQLSAQGKRLPVPKVAGGKPQNVIVERSDAQADYIGVEDANGQYPKGTLIHRSENLPKRPEKGADNMLKIMSDARKAALDMRLVDGSYGDYAGSKVNEAADSIKENYDKWQADSGTQLVFIDLSTPKGAKAKEAQRIRDIVEKAEQGDQQAQDQLDKLSPDELLALDGDFSVYDDLRAKLIKRGIPEAEIAFIHDANTEAQKEELFGKVRSGRVRVLFGSTSKMGAGMNVQDRLVALHHLDAPWRPSDLEQREGRIIRQGNILYSRDPDGFEVQIRRYATKQTLDSRMWQTIEAKARFIEQVRKGATNVRQIEDVAGEAANAAEMKAASSGNPLILEEMDLRQKLRKAEASQMEHDREQHRIQKAIREEKAILSSGFDQLKRLEADAKAAEEITKFSAKVGKTIYDKPKEAGAAILVKAGKMADAGTQVENIGQYGGFTLELENISGSDFYLNVIGQSEYDVKIEGIERTDPTGLIQRMRNAVSSIEGMATNKRNRLAKAKENVPKLEKQITEWDGRSNYETLKQRHNDVIAELKPKENKPEQEADVSDMAMGMDTPGDRWVGMYRGASQPARPADDTITVDGREVKLSPVHEPTRREGIRVMLQDIIGTRLYQGKVKGQSRLGFYRKSNSEVRIKNYDDVEVMAHEMAHYLDSHYTFDHRFRDAYKDSRFKEEITGVSYTSADGKKYSEGFAEYVRLWLTQYDNAKQAAPLFTKEFERVLNQDAKLAKKMRSLQDEMHKWYLQGSMAQLRAKSGKNLTPEQQIMEYMQSAPTERYRQQMIDRIHAAKVVERTIHGDIQDASRSAYKQFQMVNGAESIHESVMKDGVPVVQSDGSLKFEGKGLQQVFWPAAKHGWKRFDELMDYFKARRADELMKQGRENLFTGDEIKAGLSYGVKYPEFARIFNEFQTFNQKMLDFYEAMGLITAEQREAFADMNRNYVPFHRVSESLEHGEVGESSIGARLTGDTRNVRDIAENIVEGVFTNIRAALIARAKQTLYSDIINSQDGALFASKIAPDSKKLSVHHDQMANNVAATMASLGLSVSDDGMMIAGDINAEQITDVKDIEQRLLDHPELLDFWMVNQKPTTHETYVDGAIVDGKRVWMEVNSPLLVDMLTGLRGFKSGALLNALYRVKNFQTRTVTSMLQFLGPNAVRDTLSAFVISKNKFIPVYDTIIGMGHTMFRTGLYKEFRQNGGAFGTRIQAFTEETRSRRQLDLPSRNNWDRAAKALAGWDQFASLFELGSRVGDYRRGKAAGKNPIEAAWEAREVATDFAKMGANEMWAKFLRTVPFMNAGIQGLDKTTREILELKGEMKGANLAKFNDAKVRFLMAGGVLTAMTVILWLLNEDDERYQALTKDERARYWWIFLPNLEKPIKIPRPYDVGHLFATLPETALNYVKDRDGKEAAQVLGFTLVNTLGVGDYPGILQPFIEANRYNDSGRGRKFTGAPVVPAHLVNVPAEYQYTDRTPIIYRKLGETLKVSPLMAEHYSKGFLRYVEHYIADASEAYLWNEEEWGERPFARQPIDYVAHQFQGKRVPYRTKWTEGYYELKTRAAGMRSAMNNLQEQAIRDDAPLSNLLQDKVNTTLIGLVRVFAQIDRQFKDQDEVMGAIRYNSDLTADEKEAKIEQWYSQKNAVLGKFYVQAQKLLAEAEATIKEQ